MLAFNIVLGIILLVSFLLVLVIMVQQPKSGGLSSAFGGNAQVVGGVKKTGDFLNTSTWTLGVALIVLSLISNLILSNNRGQAQGGSIFDGGYRKCISRFSRYYENIHCWNNFVNLNNDNNWFCCF